MQARDGWILAQTDIVVGGSPHPETRLIECPSSPLPSSPLDEQIWHGPSLPRQVVFETMTGFHGIGQARNRRHRVSKAREAIPAARGSVGERGISWRGRSSVA